jgi:hypothetical protein
MPLDTFVEDFAGRMEVVGHPDRGAAGAGRGPGRDRPRRGRLPADEVGIERFAFYDMARKSYARDPDRRAALLRLLHAAQGRDPSGGLSMKPIVILGIFVADTAYRADRLPKMGETILGQQFRAGAGGQGVEPGRRGGEGGGRTVHFITRLGRDDFAKVARAPGKRRGASRSDRGRRKLYRRGLHLPRGGDGQQCDHRRAGGRGADRARPMSTPMPR